jgi:hypothetical protein
MRPEYVPVAPLENLHALADWPLEGTSAWAFVYQVKDLEVVWLAVGQNIAVMILPPTRSLQNASLSAEAYVIDTCAKVFNVRSSRPRADLLNWPEHPELLKGTISFVAQGAKVPENRARWSDSMDVITDGEVIFFHFVGDDALMATVFGSHPPVSKRAMGPDS